MCEQEFKAFKDCVQVRSVARLACPAHLVYKAWSRQVQLSPYVEHSRWQTSFEERSR
jgi:hypothetical protein